MKPKTQIDLLTTEDKVRSSVRVSFAVTANGWRESCTFRAAARARTDCVQHEVLGHALLMPDCQLLKISRLQPVATAVGLMTRLFPDPRSKRGR